VKIELSHMKKATYASGEHMLPLSER
jgi:hypothetical protein